MRAMPCLLVLVFFSLTSVGQTVEEHYPDTFWCANDTFLLGFKGSARLYPYRVSREGRESPGTDATPGGYATLYFGKDSLRLNYHNQLPYAHIIYVNFASPRGKTTLRFHFNDLACYFSPEYMTKYRGSIRFDIPEPYELANVIWTLSPAGARAKDLNKYSSYYEKVVNYFKPYLDHPVFKYLDFPDSIYAEKYYDFRENSFAFNFEDDDPASGNTRLLFNGPYYYVYGQELADSSLFGRLKPLVEDFAAKSGFRKFYRQNQAIYQAKIDREKQLLPVRQMWDWLEKEFPGSEAQSYRIVFSPLIEGSHSTQRYATYDKTSWFLENVMFICGTDRYDTISGISERDREGLMSGIVFTEIDHNYVNPVSNKYRKLIDSLFSNRAVWVRPGSSAGFYSSPISVFNEYMTHAVFCLYVLDTYEKPVADLVIDRREKLMVERRNFARFKEFDAELIRLRRGNKNIRMADLYPLILDWCRLQN